MLDDVVRYLACPHCGGGLARDGGTLRCATGHVFDIARQGYVSLFAAGAGPGRADTAAMVAARAGFLAAGHYARLAAELAAALATELPGDVPGCVADVGTGTGYYLAAALEQLPGRYGVALDASKFALRRAARAHPRLGAVACDVWRRIPLTDGAAAAALSVFAPRDGAGLRRVLHPGGWLFVVTPRAGHLAELAGPLGLLSVDARKPERLAATLEPHFTPVWRREHTTTLTLDRVAAQAAAAMGPSAWHTDPDTLAQRAAALPDPVPVTLAVTLSAFRARP